MATSAALLRGNAAGKLALGADGLCQFNFFIAESDWCLDFGMRTDYGDLRGLDDLESLRGKPKHYTLSTPPRPAMRSMRAPVSACISLKLGNTAKLAG